MPLMMTQARAQRRARGRTAVPSVRTRDQILIRDSSISLVAARVLSFSSHLSPIAAPSRALAASSSPRPPSARTIARIAPGVTLRTLSPTAYANESRPRGRSRWSASTRDSCSGERSCMIVSGGNSSSSPSSSATPKPLGSAAAAGRVARAAELAAGTHRFLAAPGPSAETSASSQASKRFHAFGGEGSARLSVAPEPGFMKRMARNATSAPRIDDDRSSACLRARDGSLCTLVGLCTGATGRRRGDPPLQRRF